MDFRNIKCINSSCIEKNITMNGAGGQFGSRVEYAKVVCPECDLTLAIVPLKEGYSYNIEAKTPGDLLEERLKKASELELLVKIDNLKKESELELAKKLKEIKDKF